MNPKMREILDKVEGSAVLYVKIAPDLEIEDKEGIPYEVEGDSLIFTHGDQKIALPVPANVLIEEYPGGSDRIGDAQGLDLRTPDFNTNASIEYSYGKTQEYYQKLRQRGKEG